jgi:tRNA 2-thiouridine synthesizing protein A
MNDIVELDARRLLCPMPVIRLQDCLEKQVSGAKVRVTCTDPGTMNDIPTWCRINGHQVLEQEQREHDYIFLVQKETDGS